MSADISGIPMGLLASLMFGTVVYIASQRVTHWDFALLA